jgi:hypothetical protein
MHFLTVLLLAVSGASIGLVGNNHLMYQRFIEVTPKQGVGGSNG